MKTEHPKSSAQFPADLAVLLSGYWLVPPIFLTSALIYRGLVEARKDGGMALIVLAALLGGIGVCLLFFARLPLYRQRRFLQWGPRGLDDSHRRLYRWAYGFVIACISLLGLLITCVGG